MARGTATLDFGSGGQRATVTVTGQAAIVSGSDVEAYLMGDSTADNNAYGHAIVPMVLRATNIVAGVGFDIEASCEWVLHGTFKCRWVWL